MLSPLWLSMVSVGLISLVLIITSLRRVPGIGIIFAIAVILATLFITHNQISILGFIPHPNWGQTILLALGCGVGIYIFSTLLLEPLLQRLTHRPLDYTAFNRAQKSWRQLLVLLVVSWVLAASLEEIIFRGFLVNEIASWFLDDLTGIILAILFSSIIFGLAHTYQGASGVLSTGIVGILLGTIFILGGYNIWLVIFTHGVIDTIGLTLLYFKVDQKMVAALWKRPKKP